MVHIITYPSIPGGLLEKLHLLAIRSHLHQPCSVLWGLCSPAPSGRQGLPSGTGTKGSRTEQAARSPADGGAGLIPLSTARPEADLRSNLKSWILNPHNLEVWDKKVPLVFCCSQGGTGENMVGLELHYLPFTQTENHGFIFIAINTLLEEKGTCVCSRKHWLGLLFLLEYCC